MRDINYIYERYQQQPIVITQCFMCWTQSSDGSTIQYLSVLKTKVHEYWLQCVTNLKHGTEYFKFDISYAQFNQISYNHKMKTLF